MLKESYMCRIGGDV